MRGAPAQSPDRGFGALQLRQVSERFAHYVLAGETVGRFSGDEFVFIIRDAGDHESATDTARRLLRLLEPPSASAGMT